jgi:hypothetical protein
VNIPRFCLSVTAEKDSERRRVKGFSFDHVEALFEGRGSGTREGEGGQPYLTGGTVRNCP